MNMCPHWGRYIISEYQIQYSLPLTASIIWTLWSSSHRLRQRISINKSQHKREKKLEIFYNVCTGLTTCNYVIVWRSQTLEKQLPGKGIENNLNSTALRFDVVNSSSAAVFQAVMGNKGPFHSLARHSKVS